MKVLVVGGTGGRLGILDAIRRAEQVPARAPRSPGLDDVATSEAVRLRSEVGRPRDFGAEELVVKTYARDGRLLGERTLRPVPGGFRG